MDRVVKPMAWIVLAGLFALCGGCAFGPRAIEQTHGKYASAVQRVDEEQLLRNLVRARYAETPINLDVTSIATQYELSASAEARPFFGTESGSGPVFRSFTTILPFASAGVSNRPTVSMVPQDDGTAVRRFMTPIQADTLVFLAQAGWPVGSLLRIWLDRMNGVPNTMPGVLQGDITPDFERFHRACELIHLARQRELLSIHAEERSHEVSGPLPAEAMTAAAAVEAAKNGMEYQRRNHEQTWVLVKRERRLMLQVNPAGRGSPELKELIGLLHLQPGLDQYEVVVASGVPDPIKNPGPLSPVLRVTTRSTAQVYFFLANGVDVPADHIASGVARMPSGVNPVEATRGFFHVHCCAGHKHHPPGAAYVAVWYRGHWYYIDDRDVESKATFLLLLELSRLDFKRQQIGAVPALTLPVGR